MLTTINTQAHMRIWPADRVGLPTCPNGTAIAALAGRCAR